MSDNPDDERATTEPEEPERATLEPDELGEPVPERRRRWRLRIALLVVLIAGLLGALALQSVIAVRRDLERGRSAMELGREQLLAGDASAATASFRQGQELFTEAADRARGPILLPASWLPIAGRTVDAVRAIADAGAMTGDAATRLATALAEVPGGPAGLAPARGRVPVGRIPPLAEAARQAEILVAEAAATLEGAPDSLLIGPVGPARDEAEEELGELNDSIGAAASLLQGLPAFLGADEPKMYFFGAQNPAELRGTGGLVGAYSILTIDEGRFRFSPFVPIHDLPKAPRGTQSPNADYAANYEHFRRGGRFWTAINVMPDVPSVAQAILAGYESGTGDRLDGVILADPFALEAMLQATGPVELPGYGLQIDAANVVPFTTNEAYSLFTDSTQRKRVLGDVARAAFGRFVEEPSADLADLEVILRSAADRHILVYSEDVVMQDGLASTPVGGTLEPPGTVGDLVGVVVNSAAGSKVDFYQERIVSHLVELDDDGSADATLEVTLRNHAPTSGPPPYVIGPFHPSIESGPLILESLEAGDSVALVNLYCGSDCIPVDAQLDGKSVGLASRVDLGVRYLQQYFAIPSGDEATVRLSWDDRDAWEGNSSGGVYRMTYSDQIIVGPSIVTIRIEPPAGMDIVSANSPLRIEDGAAVFQGDPTSALHLTVEFAPSMPVRLWRNVTRFLTTPVVEF